MIPRAMSVTLVSALLVGAWVGCGSDGGGGGTMYPGVGSYDNGGPATTGSSSGSATGSSSGSTTGSSSGTTGSSSGSSSGAAAEAGAPVEAGKPPLTLQEALTQFAACMSYSAFTDNSAYGYSAADVAKSQTTEYGDCNACHNAGDGGFWASYGTVQGQDMVQMMVNETQQFPYITKWVTGTVDTNGNFKTLAPSNAIADQSELASQCMQGTPCHPKFQLDPAVVSAVNAFVTNTITAWQNGTCGETAGDGGTDGGGD
jgi:hypothetical protein